MSNTNDQKGKLKSNAEAFHIPGQQQGGGQAAGGLKKQKSKLRYSKNQEFNIQPQKQSAPFNPMGAPQNMGAFNPYMQQMMMMNMMQMQQMQQMQMGFRGPQMGGFMGNNMAMGMNMQGGFNPNNQGGGQNAFSNNNTKRLALKMKLKNKKNQEQGGQKKDDAAAEKKKKEEEAKKKKEEEEAKRKEEEEAKKKKEEEEAKKKQEEEEKEKAAAEEDEDIESSESYYEEEEEDFDHLPQDRPKVIKYTPQMILEFIEKQKGKKFEDDVLYDDLVREIHFVSKRDSRIYGGRRRGGDYRNKNYGGGRDGRNRNNNYRGKGGKDRNQGGGYGGLQRGTKTSGGGGGGVPILQRQKMSKEQREKLRALREGETEKWAERNQKNVDELEKIRREINLKLFKITAENYEFCKKELKAYCDNKEHCQIFVNLLVDKAWSQPKYTQLYAKLCTQLGSNLYDWAEGENDEEKLKFCKNKFKSFVVSKIRNEFLQGFKKFGEKLAKVETDDEITEEEGFEKYLKGKKKLTGNMNFIAELYLLSYLPHKVMMFITNKLVSQYTDETAKMKNLEKKPTYPMNNEYMEALIKQFEFSGHKIYSREKKTRMKRERENKIELCPYTKIEELCKFFEKSMKEGEFKPEDSDLKLMNLVRKEGNCLELCFCFMEMLVTEELADARMISLIHNLKDRRNSGWKRDTRDSGPKKLKELQEDFEKQQQQRNSKRRGRHDREYRRGGSERFDGYGGGRGGGGGDYYQKRSGGRDSYRKTHSKYEIYDKDDEYAKKGSDSSKKK